MDRERIDEYIYKHVLGDEILWGDTSREEQVNQLYYYIKSIWGALPRGMPDDIFEEACREVIK